MNRILKKGFFILIIIIIDRLYSQDKPIIPFIQKGVCPFECCEYGKWITHSLLKVYDKEGDTSKVAFTILPIDSFVAVTGNVHIDRPGIVVVTKPNQGFAPGDTIYTLSYYGEGYINVWFHGTIYNVEFFWNTYESEFEFRTNVYGPKWSDYSGVLIERPLMIWWVNIIYKDNRKGWLKLKNTTTNGFDLIENIDGMDGCG